MEDLFQKLNKTIIKYDNIIVMGHKDPDLDSLGSCLGLYSIAEHFNKNAYLFLNYKNLENYNSNIIQAFDKMDKNIICVDEKSYKKISGNTLLIITDVHMQDRLEYPALIKDFDVIVLDHHIKNKHYISDTKFLYIDSNLSSMSELILYYGNYLNITFDPSIATILLAGIEIDTNSFNLKTTDKTYIAASILMKMGADSIVKQELLKETKDEYIKRANYIKSSFMLTDNIAMCIINNICTNVELAEVSEELLTFENVAASFTMAKIEKNTVGISARSLGNFDVEEIMKKFGGGGHTSNAAAQIKNKTLKEVKQKIKELVG